MTRLDVLGYGTDAHKAHLVVKACGGLGGLHHGIVEGVRRLHLLQHQLHQQLATPKGAHDAAAILNSLIFYTQFMSFMSGRCHNTLYIL